jgi:hypothetical protein
MHSQHFHWFLFFCQLETNPEELVVGIYIRKNADLSILKFPHEKTTKSKIFLTHTINLFPEKSGTSLGTQVVIATIWKWYLSCGGRSAITQARQLTSERLVFFLNFHHSSCSLSSSLLSQYIISRLCVMSG